MKRVLVLLKSGEVKNHSIDGSFLHCQSVLYVIYGRLNIEKVRFHVAGRWVDSPYFVNSLEVYCEQPA